MCAAPKAENMVLQRGMFVPWGRASRGPPPFPPSAESTLLGEGRGGVGDRAPSGKDSIWAMPTTSAVDFREAMRTRWVGRQ